METLNKPVIVDMPRIYDPRGNLTFIQSGDANLPFKIERAFWTYDVPAGESRGGHAHYEMEELLVALAGSFKVNVFDGKVWQHFVLNRPYKGLYIPSRCWRTMDDFSSAAVCMVLASTKFSEDDYIRDMDTFIKLTGADE